MKDAHYIGKIQTFTALFALILLPNTASSLELFEGNLGFDADWLHVLDTQTMTDRVYWYDLGDDVTYHAQFATDDAFADLVLDVSEIATNYIVPGLGVGLYNFRVREVHSSGATGSWSKPGTLEVVEDLEPPKAAILSALLQGDRVSIELEVSDDTVLRLARFTVDGEYAGTLGLKTEDYKLRPSFGEPRTVVFDYRVPKKAKTGPLEISVVVSDVAYKAVTRTVVIQTEKDSTKNARGRGRKK